MTLPDPIAEGRIAQIYPWQDDAILKLARDWVPVDWLDYEFHIAKIVHATGLNVPEPLERLTVDDRPGILYTRVEGKTMLTYIGREPHKAFGYAATLARLHREMHTKPGAPDLPGVRDRLRGKIMSVEGAPAEIREKVLAHLDTLPDGDRLLHGDFHPDNVILTPEGKRFTPVIIDWPDAARGHPLADVARTSILIRAGGLPRQPILRALIGGFRTAFHRAYLNTYFKRAPYARTDLQPWLLPVTFARLSEGIESEQAWLIGEVCGMLGIPVPENMP